MEFSKGSYFKKCISLNVITTPTIPLCGLPKKCLGQLTTFICTCTPQGHHLYLVSFMSLEFVKSSPPQGFFNKMCYHGNALSDKIENMNHFPFELHQNCGSSSTHRVEYVVTICGYHSNALSNKLEKHVMHTYLHLKVIMFTRFDFNRINIVEEFPPTRFGCSSGQKLQLV